MHRVLQDLPSPPAELPPLPHVGDLSLAVVGGAVAVGIVATTAVIWALRSSPFLKFVLGSAFLILLVAITLATDAWSSRAQTEWVAWWSAHPLFTGVFSSFLLLGAGAVAIDARRDYERRAHVRRLAREFVTVAELNAAEFAADSVNIFEPSLRDGLTDQESETIAYLSQKIPLWSPMASSWFTVFATLDDDRLNQLSTKLSKYAQRLSNLQLSFAVLDSQLADVSDALLDMMPTWQQEFRLGNVAKTKSALADSTAEAVTLLVDLADDCRAIAQDCTRLERLDEWLRTRRPAPSTN